MRDLTIQELQILSDALLPELEAFVDSTTPMKDVLRKERALTLFEMFTDEIIHQQNQRDLDNNERIQIFHP